MNSAEKKLFELIEEQAPLSFEFSLMNSRNYLTLLERQAEKHIQKAIDAGADLHALNSNGLSLMHVAAKKGADDFVVALAQLGLSPDVESIKQETAAEMLVIKNQKGLKGWAGMTLRLLLMLGAKNPNASPFENGDELSSSKSDPVDTVSASNISSMTSWTISQDAIDALKESESLKCAFDHIAWTVAFEPNIFKRHVESALSRAFEAPEIYREALIQALEGLVERVDVKSSSIDSGLRVGWPILTRKSREALNTLTFSLNEAGSFLERYPAHDSSPLALMDLDVNTTDVKKIIDGAEQYAKWNGVVEALTCLQAIDLASDGSRLELERNRGNSLWKESILNHFSFHSWRDGDPEDDDFCARVLPGFSKALVTMKKFRFGAIGDPMINLSVDFMDLTGESKDSPTDSVGRARELLMKDYGLSKSSWRLMTQNHILREALAACVGMLRNMAEEENRFEMVESRGKRAREDGSSGAHLVHLKAACALLNHGVELAIRPKAIAAMMACINGRKGALFNLLMGKCPSVSRDFKTMEGTPENLARLSKEVRSFDVVRSALLREVIQAVDAPQSEPDKSDPSLDAIRDLGDMVECAKKSPPGFWEGIDINRPFAHGKNIHADWAEHVSFDTASQSDQEKFLTTWIGVLDGVSMLGELQVKELISARDLAEEGKSMRHCVGTYAESCRRGSSRLVSLSREGQRVSTIELAPIGKDGNRIESLDLSSDAERSKVKRWDVVQHRGKFNAKVEDDKVLEEGEKLAEAVNLCFHAKNNPAHEPSVKAKKLRTSKR